MGFERGLPPKKAMGIGIIPYENMPYGHDRAFEFTLSEYESGNIIPLEREPDDEYDEFSELIIRQHHIEVFRWNLKEDYDEEVDNPDGYDDTIYLPIILYINKNKEFRIAPDLPMFNFMFKGYETQEDIDLYNGLFKYAQRRGNLFLNEFTPFVLEH